MQTIGRTAAIAVLLFASHVHAQEWRVYPVAGVTTGGGYQDGASTTARFSRPGHTAACTDAIFVADAGNHAIRRISRDGQVTTWAGALASPGSNDGSRLEARFRRPSGIAADGDCNLYVADTGNHTIRRIGSDGNVTTLAGVAGVGDLRDGTGSVARFKEPVDLVLDSGGVLWIVEVGNHAVRRLSTGDRAVTTIAGNGATGSADGTGAAARFNQPTGIGLAADDTLLVADFINRRVRRVTRDRVVTTISSNQGYPYDVVTLSDGRIIVTNIYNYTLSRVDAGNVLTDIAGKAASNGTADGPLLDARFGQVAGIELDRDGSWILTESEIGVVRRVTPDGVVAHLAGQRGETVHRDGAGDEARFILTTDIAAEADGTVWVADWACVRRVDPDGTTVTVAGEPGVFGHVDAAGRDARFQGLTGIGVHPQGGVVVADRYTIRRVHADGRVVTIAGDPDRSGFANGDPATARFQSPTRVAVGSDGTIYLAEAVNQSIRKIVGTETSTMFRGGVSLPMALVLGENGSVYYWGENDPAIFRVSADGERTEVVRDNSLFFLMSGMTRTPDGTFFVGGFRVHSILTSNGVDPLLPFAGDSFSNGNQGGLSLAARFRSPRALSAAANGRIYVGDSNHTIRLITTFERPEISSFTASSSSVRPGEEVTLTWSTARGKSFRIEPGIGEVASAGSMTVTPSGATNYSLVVVGDGGSVRANAFVAVDIGRRRSAGGR